VEGIRLEGVHGVLPEERHRPQPFVVDLEFRLDVDVAGKTDDLSDTFDYAAAARIAAEVIRGPSRRLIETLASSIAERLLAHAERVSEVRVRVHTPAAPLGLPVADVSVEVARRRPPERGPDR
jgi:dihydroneopterin aldolase